MRKRRKLVVTLRVAGEFTALGEAAGGYLLGFKEDFDSCNGLPQEVVTRRRQRWKEDLTPRVAAVDLSLVDAGDDWNNFRLRKITPDDFRVRI